jgi:hypothetical protein
MLTFVVPTGDVKIFDLGLSKEFDPAKKTASGMYHFTECTGSPRYSKFIKPSQSICVWVSTELFGNSGARGSTGKAVQRERGRVQL